MRHIYWIFLLIFFASCQTEPPPEPETKSNLLCQAETRLQAAPSGTITVGERMENPFKLNNMRRAMVSMKLREGPCFGLMTGNVLGDLMDYGSVLEVDATHYHVKISPQTLDELDLLQADTTLDLYPYPVDSEIFGEGVMPYVPTNFDPETFEETLNAPLEPQYAVIPVSKSLPEGIQYQILDELFIPPIQGAEMTGTRADGRYVSEEFFNVLVNQSMYLTGHEYVTVRPETRRWSWDWTWIPDGSVTVYDTHLERFVGVPNVKVSAKWCGVGDWAYTDENGYFRIPYAFWWPVRYKIKWENRYWDVRNAGHGQATYHGPYKTGRWDLAISADCEAYGHAQITRALSSHFFSEQPFDKAVCDHKIKVAYRHSYNSTKSGYFNYPHLFGLTRTIVIYGLQKNGECKLSQNLLCTTFHELGHCVMYHKSPINFMFYYDDIILESWASMIGWFMTGLEYGKLGSDLSKYTSYTYGPRIIDELNAVRFALPDFFNKQGVTQYNYVNNVDDSRNYTPLFIDLIDDSNQSEYFRLFRNSVEVKYRDQVFPNDEIRIQALSLLKDILYKSTTIHALKENLWENRDQLDVSEKAINDYFEFYGI